MEQACSKQECKQVGVKEYGGIEIEEFIAWCRIGAYIYIYNIISLHQNTCLLLLLLLYMTRFF